MNVNFSVFCCAETLHLYGFFSKNNTVVKNANLCLKSHPMGKSIEAQDQETETISLLVDRIHSDHSRKLKSGVSGVGKTKGKSCLSAIEAQGMFFRRSLFRI